MQEFSLTLPSGKTITGRHSLPSSSSTSTSTNLLPLIVALHGGSFTSAYFDLDEARSAQSLSQALGVPFVAVDRPDMDSYQEGVVEDVRRRHEDARGVSVNDDEGAAAAAASSNPDIGYQGEEGVFLYSEILPALWERFGGKDRSCTSIVLLAHSLGCTSAIVAAGLAGGNAIIPAPVPKPSTYPPISGIILSGWLSQPRPQASPLLTEEEDDESTTTTTTTRTTSTSTSTDDTTTTPISTPVGNNKLLLEPRNRIKAMLPPWSAPSGVRERAFALNGPISEREVRDTFRVWFAPDDDSASEAEEKKIKTGKSWAQSVHVPVMLGLASWDELWIDNNPNNTHHRQKEQDWDDENEKLLQTFATQFPRSPRIDTSVVVGAPHNLEMSHWAPGWFARCFGFAVECAVSYGLHDAS
ncbi:hypothetical protein F5Y17DRAFT_445322 [Xylariaceae sp. FL0594]|nr:hypothetical protein F5Y17DRAFT_445322 [Xylariaceae sp. FL0594]